MTTNAFQSLSEVGPEYFEALQGAKFNIEGAQGLTIPVELLSVSRGRPLPDSARIKRKQPFTLLLQADLDTPLNISGTFLFHLDGFPQEPVFLNRISAPIDRPAEGVYLQVCFG